MAQESGPFDEQNLAEDAYRDLASPWLGDGIIGDPGSSTLQVYADGSGMQVKLRIGRAQIQGFRYRNTAEVIVSIPSNGSGSVRIDRIVLRLDPTANTILPFRVAGTPGAGAPPVTRAAGGVWDIYVAQVRVESGVVNIAADKVADERIFTGLRTLIVTNAASLSLIDSPRLRQRAVANDTGLTHEWSGSAWVPRDSARTTISAGVLYGGNNNGGGYSQQSGWWQVIGGVCFWQLALRTSTNNPNGQVSMNVPWSPAGGTPAPVPATSAIGGSPSIIGGGVFVAGGSNTIAVSLNVNGNLLDGRGGSAGGGLNTSGQAGDVIDVQGHYAI